MLKRLYGAWTFKQIHITKVTNWSIPFHLNENISFRRILFPFATQRNAHFTKSVNISWCSKYTQTIGYQIIFVPMRTQTESKWLEWKMRPYLFKSALITLKWNSNKVIKSNDLSLLVLANAFRLIIYMSERTIWLAYFYRTSEHLQSSIFI